MGWASSGRARPIPGSDDPEESLAELAELASSAGAEVVGSALQRSPHPDPATFVGRGKAAEIRGAAAAADANCFLFDVDLTPTQNRNLEQALELKVLDRTQLILDIFARRARSREGQLQVELAQLNYLLPRLGGRGTLLSRLGGGIGTRGPGEQQLEFDRRRIRARIKHLKESIERVRSERALHRARRREREFMTVALVGYTNAGKSTLFNALTQAQVMTSSRLFATLDPTVRALPLPSRRPALASDTVGFIRKLPPHLVASFRATLEELKEADLLLHVTDASDPKHPGQDAAVEALLEELGLASTPRLHVWNKIDRLDPAAASRFGSTPSNVSVSAVTREGLDVLLRRIDEALDRNPMVESEIELPSADGEGIAFLHRVGTVMSMGFKDDHVTIRVRIPASVASRFARDHAVRSTRSQ